VLAAEPPPPEEVRAAPAPVARLRPPIDPCEEAADAPVPSRPTLNELVAVRAAELDDRVRDALRRPDASPELRAGLLGALAPTSEESALAELARAPDRHRDGFDHLTAVLSVLAWQALAAHDTRRARALSLHASRLAPSDPLPRLALALAAEAEDDPAAAREALAEAFRLEPDEPAIALAYARRLRHGVELSAALAALDHYLAAHPDDAQLARLRARLLRRREAMPASTPWSSRGLTVLAPSSVPRRTAEEVLAQTEAALGEAARLLGVPRRAELSVFVYARHADLLHANCAQSWVGALYDGSLHVDAERLAAGPDALTSLRHEALHASLHGALEETSVRRSAPPTWFDEGLAQYFAPEEPGPERSFALIARERTYVPLASMNGAFLVIDDPRDAGLAYHQALLMVRWLVERRGERGIAEAVRWLAEGGPPERLLEGVGAPLDGEALVAFAARAVSPR
jgi:tetratricopeptide (TPR) repeat protein